MTSDEAFSVDLVELDDFLGSLRAFVEHVEDRMGHLDGVVESLGSSWTGESAAAHRDAHARWTEGAHEMRMALVSISDSASRSHAVFSGVQDLHSRMWP